MLTFIRRSQRQGHISWGMSHDKACSILEDMVQKGWIDAAVTDKLRSCFEVGGRDMV